MRFLPTRIHGYLDYLLGVLLIVAPWLFGFAGAGGAETWIPVILGIVLIVYSLFTDYELGVRRAIPMSTHLWLDAIGGIFLAVSPWLFGFSDLVWAPHLVVGLIELVVSLVTHVVPGVATRRTDRFEPGGPRPVHHH